MIITKMKKTTVALACIVSIIAHTEELKTRPNEPTPGRLGYPEICVAQFGQTRMFFYMSSEKHELAKNFIHDVNNNMLHGTMEAELDFPVFEVSPIATIYKEPIGFDMDNNPIYVDQKGTLLFQLHAKKVKELAEKSLDIHLHALSQEMSLILNFDANKFHQDQCIVQYDFLKNHTLPIPEYTIFQDLTLIDWEMAEGTISGTIIEDAESHDRFLLPLYSSEIACNVYTEPAIYLGPYEAPEYPGAATLIPHSPIAPIDRYGDRTPGSSKGKRMSVAVRGLVLNEEINQLQAKSKQLPVNRPVESKNLKGALTLNYANGIVLHEILTPDALHYRLASVRRHPPIANVEVYETNAKDYEAILQAIADSLNLQFSKKKARIFHLIKRDGGFSNVPFESLDIPKDSTLFLINRSTIPTSYLPYPIAEDLTSQGTPWIQFYYFPANMVMQIPASKLNDLSLTPLEEILFRDGITDINCVDPNIFVDKFFTRIDIVVLSNFSESI